ncbi:MAG: outer membrane beta-barrel protein [Chitinophagales bacterium]
MKFFRNAIFFPAIFFALNAHAQIDSILDNFSFTGYVDAYFAVYNDSLDVNDYQKFAAVSPRSNHIGLNVASLSAKYTSEHVRGTVILHYGDIPRCSWSPTFNFVQEANVGIRICKKLWFDGGFFRSHVGTEGWFPKENITSSVAIATYYEPLYEAGFRLNYNPSDKLAINLYLLNGYNLYEDNNKKKSIGLLATYAFTDNLSMGYNNYLGDDTPVSDTTDHLRFYNNVFLNYEKNKIKIVTGVDFGFQGDSYYQQTNTILSGLFAIRYMATEKFDLYGRVEGYYDPDGILSGIVDSTGEGLQIGGLTIGAEYKPTANSYIRLEGRDLISDSGQEIFYRNNDVRNSRFEMLFNLGVWFP